MTILHLIHTGASFFVSLASFITFTIFNNSFGAYHGALAATGDGFSFAVVYFYWCRLDERVDARDNTINSIRTLSVYGFLLILLNLIQFLYRLTVQLRYEPAIFPVSKSNFFDLIVCAIGFKAGICLVYYCLCYKRRNNGERQPLLAQNGFR